MAVTVSLQAGTLCVRASFAWKEHLKKVPGARWNPTLRAWTFPGTSGTAGNLLRLFARTIVQWSPEAAELKQAAEQTVQNTAIKTATVLPPIPCSATDAWLHQRQAYWFAHDLPAAMLALDMGTGKSKVAIDLLVNRQCMRTLILAPLSVMGENGWTKQFRVHAGNPVHVAVLTEGSVAVRAKMLQQAMALAEARQMPFAGILNYEAAWRPEMSDILKGIAWDMVVLDEIHKIKAPGSKVSRFCAGLTTRSKFRLGLTGTPMPHSPLDVYGQYRFLDPGIYGTSFQLFRARYAVMGGYGNHEVVGYRNLDALHEKFYSIGFRVMKGDVLDLPPVLHLERTCQLSAGGRKVYRELEREFVAELDTGTVTAAHALTRLLRLQQVTSGYLPDDEGRVSEIDPSKRELLAEVLEALPADEPVVVFARFTHDLATIRTAAENLQRTCSELSGRINQLAEWQAGHTTLLAVQIQAGGVGIDLTRAAYAVYYSLGFSLGDYEQSLARLDRPGQTRSVRYIHLIADRTIDGRIYQALRTRKEVVENILTNGLHEELA